MQRKQFLLRWLALPILITGMGWQFVKTPAASSQLVTPVAVLQVEVPYEVLVRSEGVSLDLPCDENAEYDLIVSSLGNAQQTFEITLTSNGLQNRQPSRIKQLPKLPPPTHRNPLHKRGKSVHKNTQQATHIKPATKNRTFRLHVTTGLLNDPAQYIAVPSRLVQEGKRVRVYLDHQTNQQELANDLLDEIIYLFDHKVVPGFQKQIGTVRDIDGDGKFTVLLTPWLEKLQGGKTSLDGFVRGSDFDPNVSAPFGHQCDMMYLNTHLQPNKHLHSLIAHEWTHAILFSHRLSKVNSKTTLRYEEDWLNEAIAHLGENMHGGGWTNLDYRISKFLESPQNYPLVVSDYYRSGMWRNHGCRGATYLFLRWVVDQYGVQILPALMRSSYNGTRNIEQATGASFAELFRQWNVAMVMSQRGTSTYQSQKSTVDLWGTVGKWNLAGVATTQWNIAKEVAKRINVKGTTSAFIRLSASTSDKQSQRKKYQRINIQAEPDTLLQVTFIKRSAIASSLELTPKMTTSPNTLQADIKFDSTQSHIETISVETTSDDNRESVCFSKGHLKAYKSKTGCYLLPLPSRLQSKTADLLIKAVVVNRNGTRTATREILHLQPKRITLR